jgi:hypothetical protein
MTTDTLYDALEVCLKALEQGADVEACLVRFPALADELRPILEVAAQARSAAVPDIPPAVMRRGKARVLQAAAELREQAAAPRRGWQFGRTFRLGLAALAMIAFLLTGGTGLVGAASNTLPGDSLYPVKRSWEGFRLLLVVDPKAKSELEDEFEHERVQEIHTLFTEGRMEQVNFQGIVEDQQADYWQIQGLRIAVDHETVFNSANIVPGALVQVLGETDDGIIKAERINLITVPVATYTPGPKTVEPRPTDASGLRPTETESPEFTETAEPTETLEPTETAEPTEIETEAPEATKPPKEKNNNGNENENENEGGGGNENG